ncbi:hypothetical protein CSKR_100220 [Clonorchis sinensis]|uniref:Uncharacterized protein n=1 Tax=Clonorchis sinensis TaxID=79923 RepID=A0A3R7CBV6_CLOSI|nr:hypothetical protein CSKR_100220 [Clonorchis sinensis]
MRLSHRHLAVIIACQFLAILYLLTANTPAPVADDISRELGGTNQEPNQLKKPENISANGETISISRDNYAQIQRELVKAYRSARAGGTQIIINRILKLLDSEEIEHQFFREPSPVGGTQRLEACPEKWGESKSDEDHFGDAYEIIPCDHIPREELVEVLIYSDTYRQGEDLVRQIRSVYPSIGISLALRESHESGAKTDPELSSIKIHWGEQDVASTWLALSKTGSTKYILVGRNMVNFTYHSDIDRMLRVMNSLAVDAVGGAVRLEPEGRWFAGCYQAGIRNFTLRLHPGHDISVQSCAYCDYIASPFLIKRTLFQKHMEDSKLLSGPVAFVHMFLGSVHKTGIPVLQTVACVDLMFHVAGNSSGSRGQGVAEMPKSSWIELAQRWIIDRILLPGDVEHRWTCEDVNINCYSFKTAGVILPRCCIEELAQCVKGFFTLAAENNVGALVVFGTTVGAVKISGGFLPWERDADLIWDAYKYQVVGGIIKESLQQKYKCRLGEAQVMTKFGYDISACSKITNGSCLYHALYSGSWRIEMYGEPVLVSHRLHGFEHPTTVNLDGLWVPTLPNPGRFVRVLYGDNVLGHVQNWVDYGKVTGWARYTKVQEAGFLPCPVTAVRHACLSGNYLPYGNIQFQDIPI